MNKIKLANSKKKSLQTLREREVLRVLSERLKTYRPGRCALKKMLPCPDPQKQFVVGARIAHMRSRTYLFSVFHSRAAL